jgi:hypothetical protein
LLFFYITLINYFPRNCYKFVKPENVSTEFKPIINQCENLNKLTLRKKLITDLKIHNVSNNWNKKNVTKIILNREGKIVGYKFYRIFYPNYFTKTQNNKIVSKINILKSDGKYFLVTYINN